MCDYSLMSIQNRLAREGEHLVAHRFSTGSMGLASPPEVHKEGLPDTQHKGFWAALKSFFVPPPAEITPAVCIPPGARLRLQDIPVSVQRELQVGETEHVVFTQLTAAVNRHRDAFRFMNGREILLQKLSEGQRVVVLDLSGAEEREPVQEGIRVLTPR